MQRPRLLATPTRRALLGALAGGAVLSAGLGIGMGGKRAFGRSAGTPTLRLLSHASLPAALQVKGTTVGGLSGLAFDAGSDLWYALSDDRGRRGPVRCYVLRLPPPVEGQPLTPQWVDTILLRGKGGKPFTTDDVDPEALALRRNPVTGELTLLWADEGNVRTRVPPALYESSLDGRLLRELTLPAHLREVNRRNRGPRNNETLEGLTLTPDGRHAWAAMEGALVQDRGRASTLPRTEPGPCRFTRIDLATGRADLQVAYQPEPMPFGPTMPSGPAESGVSEILMHSADRIWVLERAWSISTGVSVRLYEADLPGATDTLNMDTLRPGRFQPMAKRLLLNLRDSGLPHIDNFEAMAWGPPQANGHRTLVMCTDDNFNPLQVTQFAAFEVVSG